MLMQITIDRQLGYSQRLLPTAVLSLDMSRVSSVAHTMHGSWGSVILIVVTGFVAGSMNAVAGGGPLLTLPILMHAGLDARAASMTTTVALFPGQVATGIAARGLLGPTGGIPLHLLLALNIVGGAIGAILLIVTPTALFSALVPWLVMFATAVYAWSSFAPSSRDGFARIGPVSFGLVQLILSIYGGYFGGGNSFLMLATLLMAGMTARSAGGLKNLLIALINSSAVVVLVFSPSVDIGKAITLGLGAFAGSLTGVWLLNRVDERWLRIVVVTVGIGLTCWLFWNG